MVKAPIYTIKGTKTGEQALPTEVFGVKPNLNLLAQAIYVYQEKSHTGLRKTKTRAEVNRTTKKLYKQKGTGGARHGSRRAPIFVGGGIAHGPRPVRRILKLSTTLKNKAKAYAFSLKADEKEIIVVDGVSKIAKTKEAGDFLKKVSSELKKNSFTFVLSEKAKGVSRFLRNLGNAEVLSYKEVNAFDIWNGGVLVMDRGIFEGVNSKVKTQKSKVQVKIKKVQKKK